MKNFIELKTDVGVLVQRDADTNYLAKIGVWVNWAQEYLFNIYDYWQELQDYYDFTTVDGTEKYYLPKRFNKPLRIYDMTNNTKLVIQTEEQYFDGNISNISNSRTAKPMIFREFGVVGNGIYLGTTGYIFKAKSSNASDTAVVVRIKGFVDTERTIIASESITVTGTTYVLGLNTYYGDIISLSKDIDSVGYITIATSTDVVVSTLDTTERVAYYKIAKLGLIPNDEYDIRILFKRRINKMVNDNDYPFVDADEFITLQSAAYGYQQEKEGVERAAALFTKAQEALKTILINQQNSLGPDYQQKIISGIMRSHRS